MRFRPENGGIRRAWRGFMEFRLAAAPVMQWFGIRNQTAWVAMTDLAELFRRPRFRTHIQYEALRARFLDGLEAGEAAKRFGYSLGSFRNLCTKLRGSPDLASFFAERRPGPKPDPEEPLRLRRDRRILELRRTCGLPAGGISRRPGEEGMPAGTTTVRRALRRNGIGRLPRRPPGEREAALRPVSAPSADARELDPAPQRLRTGFGGLFLSVPDPVRTGLDRIGGDSGMPGSAMIPAGHAFRALPALKLWGVGRPLHAMADILDPGMALFAGLNAMPKRSSLSGHSGRVDPKLCAGLMDRWHRALNGLEADLGGDGSSGLGFHTVPWHGKDPEAPVEKHYVSKRSRRQKGILAFLARDADARLPVYADARVRKEDRNDGILRFIGFREERSGGPPRELVFDSRLTTHASLGRIDAMGIDFLTLRRRSRSLLDALADFPEGEWKQVRLNNVGRIYRTPRILDRPVRISGYPGDIRQLAVRGLGHEQPTLLLTNQMKASAGQLVDRYARRMAIENAIADAIDFFHMDALSATVPMKIDLDLQLTLMASGLYRLLAVRVGNGKQTARSRTLFRNFVKAPADITVGGDCIDVRIGRRANNPFLLNASYDQTDIPVPWLKDRRLRISFL